MAVEFHEELVLQEELAVPLGGVDLLELLEGLGGDLFPETGHVDVLVLGDPADRSLERMGTLLAALDDPLEHAHVVAESGPEEFPLGALAEPVHVEDARHVLHEAPHLQPVGEVVAHVVAAEGEHRHRVAAHLADRAGRGRRHLGADGRAEVDTVDPVEGLEDERHRRGAATAEDHRADPHSLGILPVGIDDRAVLRRCGKAAIRVA